MTLQIIFLLMELLFSLIIQVFFQKVVGFLNIFFKGNYLIYLADNSDNNYFDGVLIFTDNPGIFLKNLKNLPY